MKSNELMKCIHRGEIKENSKIKVFTEDRKYITTIEYKNGKLEWKSGEFDTSYLCSIFIEFELIEDKEEIDIQIIEELNTIPFITTGDNKEIENFIKKTNKIVIDNFYTVNNIINKQNELIKAIKQIDKHIHCKVCKKELAVKYGLCEKCYEAANEDVR